jgi:hypothetical protein
MKKIMLSAFAALLLLTVFPANANAGANPIPVTTTTPTGTESAESQAMMARLNEIKAMDMKSLSASEKKQLRNEVKAMKQQAKSHANGVYLSVGAILIIILLVVLLL